MVEIIFHWVLAIIPILLFFPQLNKKHLLLASSFVILPDLEKFIDPLNGRMLFHNIFFILIVLLLAFLLIKRRSKVKNALPAIALLAFFLLSHFVLDLSAPGFSFFYPVSSSYQSFSILVYTLKAESFSQYHFDVAFNSPLPHYAGEPNTRVYLSNPTFFVLIFLLGAFLLSLYFKLPKKEINLF